MVKLSTLINNRPEDLVFAAKRKVFLFKERNFRFRRFSKHQKQGVNLVGFIRAEMGLGQAARGIARALESADIPFNIINLDWHKGRHGDLSWMRKEVADSDYDVTVVVANPDSMFTVRERLPNSIFRNRFVVGYWIWELPNVPADWLDAFSLVNEVWAASSFVQTVVAKKCPVPVTRIPLVVELERGNLFPRRHFDLRENVFLFLSMCDTGSVFERKNPLGAIEAFKKAFSPDDPTVVLIVKITGPPTRPPNWDLIQTHIRGYKNIRLIDRLLTREEVSSLLLGTDCLVSLHRSEGFGLLPAEAMSLGKPVIVTNWSGNVDYMTSENSVGINYKLVELDQNYGPYEAGQHWAEPDIDQAADWMKKLAADPDLSERIGRLGQRTINADYSPEAIGKIIRARLERIREQYN
ncbi:MAG: glycosyl transferase family 1 [Acidobacteria bacterium]|nr:MAG: glycosyl transferase family 1 [Acidobacteriota bacterium]